MRTTCAVTALLAGLLLLALVNASTEVRIVILGDSNSIATPMFAPGEDDEWPFLLQAALEDAQPAVRVLNNAAGGFSVRKAHLGDELRERCLQYDPHIVIVMLGTNDIDSTLADYSEQLRSVVDRIAAHRNGDGTSPVVILMQPPVAMGGVNGTRAGYTGYNSSPYKAGDPYVCGRPYSTHDAGNGGVHDFADAVSALARERSLPLVPVFDSMVEELYGWRGETNVRNRLLMDGVHLSVEGHAYIAHLAIVTVQRQISLLADRAKRKA